MRNFATFILLLIASCTPRQEVDTGFEYLGQPRPKETPQIFAPNIVSIHGRFELGLTISPNGKSLAFGVAHESDPSATCIYLMNLVNGKWGDPDKTVLPDNINTYFPMFGPTGKELYFIRSIDGSETDLWVATFLDNKILDPQPLDSIINSKSREAGHGKSKKGSIYFTSNRDDMHQCCGDIYLSEIAGGNYSSVEKVEVLNSDADEESLFLSPDEDYILIQAWKNEFGSKHDLYLSYRTKNNSWTKPERLDSGINSKEIEQRPFVSADNKFLFFSRMSIKQENGQDTYESDIYWVSTQSIFKPYPYNPLLKVQVGLNKPFEIQIPGDLFEDIDGDIVSYEVSLGNNAELPEWIKFDESKLLLTGTWKSKNLHSIAIAASDNNGNRGLVSIPILIKAE